MLALSRQSDVDIVIQHTTTYSRTDILTVLLQRSFQASSNNEMAAKAKLNVHNFPRPPLLELTPRHLLIQWNGKTLADTKAAYWALETTHPPSKSKSRGLHPA